MISSAIKADKIKEKDAVEVIDWLMRLNDKAAALVCGAKAATDITGFSLLGHAWEMADASHTGIRFYLGSIPLYGDVSRLADEWCFPGGAFNNADYFKAHIKFDPQVRQETQMDLFDPQTSGGLLFAVKREKAEFCEREALGRGVPLWKIGEVTDSGVIEVALN